jgi:hypothetical protein
MLDVKTAMGEKSAEFTLRLHDDFHSDRALRVRHGAVMHLKEQRGLDWDCDENISPHYDQAIRPDGLNSDVVDVLNMLDRVGFLAYDRESPVVNEAMALDRFGRRVKFYYEACKKEIEDVRRENDRTWWHLNWFYERYNSSRKAAEYTEEAIDRFLKTEHVRSHRGSGIGYYKPPERRAWWRRLFP